MNIKLSKNIADKGNLLGRGRIRVIVKLCPAIGLLLLYGLILASCASVAERDIKDLKRVILDDIEAMIEQGDLFPAYQEISLQKREPTKGFTPAVLARLEETILEQTVQEFEKFVDERDYEQAYRYFCSLRSIQRLDLVPGWSSGRIFAGMARNAAEEENIPLAFLYTVKALLAAEQGEWNQNREARQELEDTLSEGLALAEELGNKQIAEKITAAMKELGLTISPTSRIIEVPPVEKIIRGTATIWVNRGIKIERGVGYPDRVIGSAFFIDKRGYLLTNYHVIASEVDPKYEGYSRLYIRMSDRVDEKIPAKVVGYDRIFDLALIKAEVEPEYVFSAGEIPQLKPGDSIIAIGSPAGLENTVTSGIVSAIGRRFLQMGDTIQVDVPINYGNSGGPLLDTDGRLVGVVYAGIEQFEGINFAIPFFWVNKAIPNLYRGGEVEHPWLGLALQKTEQGLEIVYTVPGEPGARAGLKTGDILVSLNNQVYSRLGPIQAAVLDLTFPCLVTLRWIRDGVEMEGVLALSKRPYSPIDVALERDTRDNVLFPLFGIQIEKTGKYLFQSTYIIKQVLQGSIADDTGLTANDPLRVQGWKIDEENRYAVLQLFVKKRKSGFLESVIQLAAYLETDVFL